MLSLENPVAIISTFIVMALLPFAVLGLTSFVKLSVVFGLLRNAIGAQQVPSAAITTLLSIALTVHIMLPVITEISASVEPVLISQKDKGEKATLAVLFESLDLARKPVSNFLSKHSRADVVDYFANASAESPVAKAETCPSLNDTSDECDEKSILSLVPAFVISELQEAFTIGVFIFLPFLVLDLVVANILVGMGMMMVSPVTISMPLKIMLFVLCDGWFLLSQSLIAAYR